MTLTIRSDKEWGALCKAIGMEELVSDERFLTAQARKEHHHEIDELISSWTSGQSRQELVRKLQGLGIASAPVLDAADLVKDPHLRSRGYFCRDAESSEGEFIGQPFRMSNCQGSVRWRGPDLGRDNARLLGGLRRKGERPIKPVDGGSLGTAYDLS